MKYRVLWTRAALNDLKKLGKNDSRRILGKVEDIVEDPFRYVKKLRGLPFYSLRIGKYRVILILDTGKHIIYVVAVEHREKAYKKL